MGGELITHEPKRAPPGFTATTLVVAAVFAVAAALVIGLVQEFVHTLGGQLTIAALLLCLCIAVALGIFLNKTLPAVTIRRYADCLPRPSGLVDGERSAAEQQQEDGELTSDTPFAVAYRYVPGNAAVHRPNGVLFYPTDEHDLVRDDNPWAPYDDFAYAAGVMAEEGLPGWLACNMHRSRFAAAKNAPPAKSLTSEALGATKQHPLIHFGHGDSGHMQFYVAMISDMVAGGAVVYAVDNTEGKAAHALVPPSVPSPEADFERVARGEPEPKGVLATSHRRDTSADDVVAADESDEEIEEYRRMNYTTRVPETAAAVAFLARDGGAHRALGLDPRECSVTLMGHSAGGGAAVAVVGELLALDAGMPNAAKVAPVGPRSTPLINGVQSLVLFDPAPSHKRFVRVVAHESGSLASRLPPACFVLSQEWLEPPGPAKHTERMMRAYPEDLKHVREWPGTDHTMYTDAALMVRVPGVRPSYISKTDDRRQMARWARDALLFIRNHTEGPWQSAM